MILLLQRDAPHYKTGKPATTYHIEEISEHIYKSPMYKPLDNPPIRRYLTPAETAAYLLGAPASSFPVDPPPEDAVSSAP